jgi:hypothetical protein
LAGGRWLNVDPDIKKSAQNFNVRQGVTREWQSAKRSATLTGTIFRLPCTDAEGKKELVGQVRADWSIGLKVGADLPNDFLGYLFSPNTTTTKRGKHLNDVLRLHLD